MITEREHPYQTLLVHLESARENGLLEHTIVGNEIVDMVMAGINDVAFKILMTMDLAEELKSPLPTDYHLLLSQKLAQGVRITRVGFGTEQEFLEVARTRSFPSDNLTFIHNPSLEEYQRMILLDDTILFFRYNGVFFRSTNPSLVEQFQQYFSLVSRAQNSDK